MTPADPIKSRCLSLLGSFETSQLPPGCWGVLSGDFDGQGLSFSVLQFNLGRNTLQPLLAKMLQNSNRPAMQSAFGALTDQLAEVLRSPHEQQMTWARSIQTTKHEVQASWAAAFSRLGATKEWQKVATEAAGFYFEKAQHLAELFHLTSDRAMALLFDIAVQNGGLRQTQIDAIENIWAENLGWSEYDKLKTIAESAANASLPRWRSDVLARKMTIANGHGTVHGRTYDLARDFGL